MSPTRKVSKVEVDQAVIMNELGHIKDSIKAMDSTMKEHVESSTCYRQQTTVNTKSIGWIWATVGLLVTCIGGMFWVFFEHLNH